MLLDGVRIVSFCHFLQGPAGAQYLADMGADVVKVEPIHGAHERRWSGAEVFVGGVSGFYLCANRNKRSIALDLKHPDGLAAARALVLSADVVMENFRPGVMDRLGLGYEDIRRQKPEIIYASASGYGSVGPDAARPGQDLLIQARSGLVAATGASGDLPSPVGAAVVDQHGAALLAMGILGALVRKQRTGEGTRVEGSLFNAGIDLQTEPLTNYASGGRPAHRFSRQRNLATWFHEAPYGVYRARDGAIVLSLNDPAVLAEALQSSELAALAGVDRHAGRDAYAAAVAVAVARFSLAELAEAFDRRSMWWAPVASYDDVLDDPQAKASGVFQQILVGGEPATLVSHPLRYDGRVMPIRHIAERTGADTAAVLSEVGYDAEAIERLAASGAIAIA